MSNNLKVRQGGQLPLTVQQGDPNSISASLYMRPQDGGAVLSVHGNFINGVADLTLGEEETATIGIYDYQINEEFASEPPIKYPDPNACEEDEDCSFPTIQVCEALDEEDA